MAGNSFGKIFTLISFGESHGKAVGGIIDGCPAGLKIDLDRIQSALDRRRPGQSRYTSPRQEKDRVEFLSGIFEGRTTGTPIGFLVWNKDQQSKDYDHIKDTYRPSHADFTYDQKYGRRDYRGGGRSSARETIARVVGGAVAKELLLKDQVNVWAYVSSMGPLSLENSYNIYSPEQVERSPVRCPDKEMSAEMQALIEKTSAEGDTLGGTITCVIQNVPAGLGEPVFDKLHAELGKAMLSINAVKGFEYGSGFEGTTMKGSEHNDRFVSNDKEVHTATNYSGGIQGGISNGEDIYLRIAFKPIATLMQHQKTISKSGEMKDLEGKGRHDVTVLPRAVPIVEAMASMVIADHLLINRTSSISI